MIKQEESLHARDAKMKECEMDIELRYKKMCIRDSVKTSRLETGVIQLDKKPGRLFDTCLLYTSGTQFRIWANSVLKEYLIKGFAINDELLKQSGGGNYFDELMDRIRDIRSSEKVFWRKVLDIYATSVDYDPRTEVSVLFFKTVQNKMHWAAHGQTAAEKIFYSADSSKPNMGLLSFSGSHPTQSDALIAKNYCTEDELLALNDIVSAYLDLAEMQARRRIPMYMSDWIDTLDGFLKLSKHEILTHAGKISAAAAERKAKEEYRKYKELQSAELSRGEKDYIAALESAEQKLLKKSDQ